MPDSMDPNPFGAPADNEVPFELLTAAVCRAALNGEDSLYEVMLKLSLMVEPVAPTYGLSIWFCSFGEAPQVKWAEGLDSTELDEAGKAVADALADAANWPSVRPGNTAICLPLTPPGPSSKGSAIYARCVRPITEQQSRKLGALVDVARLAHGYLSSRALPITALNNEWSSVCPDGLPGMIFSSVAMTEVARSVTRIKDSESAVLITGESGTGKELIARAIHRLSKRSSEAFIPFNCSAVPAELVESILFGHRKGSFTGALSENEGLIRAADRGTLFLDEIGDLPTAIQPKLLRFLQEGEIHTLGEHSPRKVSVRVIAATHKQLDQLVHEKIFREDLFYRIATLQISLPPLRDRREDIAALISHYLTHYARRNDREISGITAQAIKALQSYSWPGNVRELASEMERLVLYSEGTRHIDLCDLSSRMRPLNDAESEPDKSLEQMLEEYERQLITKTLKEHDCNVARASEALGLGSRQTLYKKLKRLAIDVSLFLQEDTEPGMQFRVDSN